MNEHAFYEAARNWLLKNGVKAESFDRQEIRIAIDDNYRGGWTAWAWQHN